MTREVDASSAVGNTDLETAASRPSKTNCTSHADGPETGDVPSGTESRLRERGEMWHRKNEIVDDFLDERPARAARPVTVRDSTTIREEATAERHTDPGDDPAYRGASWSNVLREFLGWYNGYRHAHLCYLDPDGDRVRTPLQNSHQPAYGDKYYARVKALERQLIAEYENPMVAMLTFTGSNRTDTGGWRCPADHLRDIIDSFRPDRGRGAYHALRDVLDDVDDWEYALVCEHHKSGYGHVHLAVFVDGSVSERTFRPVIDAHLENCEIAGKAAHDYHHPDDEKRPISVRNIDLDLDPEDVTEDTVGNLGSYVGEYIGAHGEQLFERSLAELQFRAVAWATGTQRVRFSNGAQDAIAREQEQNDTHDGYATIVPDESFPDDPDPEDGAPFECLDPQWSLEGIGRMTDEGEELFDADDASVDWVTVEDASHLDPPECHPPDRPQPRTSETALDDWA